jgi:hypothetical protein
LRAPERGFYLGRAPGPRRNSTGMISPSGTMYFAKAAYQRLVASIWLCSASHLAEPVDPSDSCRWDCRWGLGAPSACGGFDDSYRLPADAGLRPARLVTLPRLVAAWPTTPDPADSCLRGGAFPVKHRDGVQLEVAMRAKGGHSFSNKKKEERIPLRGGAVHIEKSFIVKYACKSAILGSDLNLRNK